MINSLYGRLLAVMGLLLGVGGFSFWFINIRLGWPDPASILVAALLTLLVAAVLLGVILHPVEQVILAIQHLAAGEELPLSEPRAKDLRPIMSALQSLGRRLEETRSGADRAEMLGVLNGLSEGVMILDAAMKPLMANTALRAMAASEPEQFAESDSIEAFRHLFHSRCFVPDQLALISDEVSKAPEKPRTDIIQLERPSQFVKRYCAPIYNKKQEHTGFLVSYHDITHEVVMDRMRQEFIANASHELRTPVTSVKLLLENLQDGAKNVPGVRDEFIDDAAREIDRMHDLVNDLLDMAALESGRNTLEVAPVELGRVIAEAIATVEPQARQREVAIFHDDLSAGLLVEADMGRVRQVLVNLVGNAVKFTPNGGQVRVRYWQEGDAALFSVSDTGIGIPAKDLTHIFDRFYRVTKGRSRLQGGSGLGLTIVKQAIDAHRGDIAVESTEGQGTTFTVTLPKSRKEAP